MEGKSEIQELTEKDNRRVRLLREKKKKDPNSRSKDALLVALLASSMH